MYADARSSTGVGMCLSLGGFFKTCRDAARRALVTQDRHSTTVPNVSKKRARGGWSGIVGGGGGGCAGWSG